MDYSTDKFAGRLADGIEQIPSLPHLHLGNNLKSLKLVSFQQVIFIRGIYLGMCTGRGSIDILNEFVPFCSGYCHESSDPSDPPNYPTERWAHLLHLDLANSSFPETLIRIMAAEGWREPRRATWAGWKWQGTLGSLPELIVLERLLDEFLQLNRTYISLNYKVN